METRPDFVTIGIVSRVHGIKGEIVVTPISDTPDQFLEIKRIFLRDQKGSRRSVEMESVKQIKKAYIIKLAGVNDRNQAETLRKCWIEKPLEKENQLKNNEYYTFELIGLKVKSTDGIFLGKVKDVANLPAHDVFVIDDGDEEILIPATDNVVKKIDLENDIMLIELIEGLI